jgi:hypothetical protein
MDDKSRIEQLERRIASLEGQLKALKEEHETETVPRQKMKLEELEVEQIRIVEKDGTVRMSIHNKERMPTLPDRKGGSSAGMLFFAEDAVEVGGLTIHNTVGLKFDQHHSSDVVGLVNGSGIKGLWVWDRPPGPMSEFKEHFERVHGRPPRIQETEFTRAFVGRWINEEARVSLADRRGRERLRLIVDSKDRSRIEFLNENGEVIHYVAPEGFTPLKLPPTDTLPKDSGDQTPAHWLGIFDNNFGKVLEHLDNIHEKFDEGDYIKWREWLLNAKKMNTTDNAV